MPVFTPDDLMAGKLPKGEVLLYDDDHYYMGGVLAELLVKNGNTVRFVTHKDVDDADIKAVATSAIGPCMLPVDADGRPLMNGVLYGVDTRAARHSAGAAPHSGAVL